MIIVSSTRTLKAVCIFLFVSFSFSWQFSVIQDRDKKNVLHKQFYLSQFPLKGRAARTPLPYSYWPAVDDSINYRWQGFDTLSPSEKYERAFGVTGLQHFVRENFGVGLLRNNFNSTCVRDSDCVSSHEELKCSKENGDDRGNHGVCAPVWWGICDGWAAFVSVEPSPTRMVSLNGVTFYPTDIAALASLVYAMSLIVYATHINNTETQIVGVDAGTGCHVHPKVHADSQKCTDECIYSQNGECEDLGINDHLQSINGVIKRWNDRTCEYGTDCSDCGAEGRLVEEACRDVNPADLHFTLSSMIGVEKKVAVLDISAGFTVWNHPVYEYQVTGYTEVNRARAIELVGKSFLSLHSIRYFHVHLAFSYALDRGGILPAFPDPADTSNRHTMTVEYVLEADENGLVFNGEYVGPSRGIHPDNIWQFHVPSDGLIAFEQNEYLRVNLSCPLEYKQVKLLLSMAA